MVMKNKLYKHHKKKMFFVFRNFAIGIFGVAAIVLAIAIPTYISSLNDSNITARAAEEKAEKRQEKSELLSIR